MPQGVTEAVLRTIDFLKVGCVADSLGGGIAEDIVVVPVHDRHQQARYRQRRCRRRARPSKSASTAAQWIRQRHLRLLVGFAVYR